MADYWRIALCSLARWSVSPSFDVGTIVASFLGGRSIRLDLHDIVLVTQVWFFLCSQVAQTGMVTGTCKQEKKRLSSKQMDWMFPGIVLHDGSYLSLQHVLFNLPWLYLTEQSAGCTWLCSTQIRLHLQSERQEQQFRMNNIVCALENS